MKQLRPYHILILFAFIVLGFGVYYRLNPLKPTVVINNTVFTVEIAATEAEKQRGLGYRDSLPSKHGMVFPYDHKEKYEYWMKGMNFPLDFLWVDGKTIVDMNEDIPVFSAGQITIIKPKVPVDKVMEFPAGTIAQFGIKIGNTVQFKN